MKISWQENHPGKAVNNNFSVPGFFGITQYLVYLFDEFIRFHRFQNISGGMHADNIFYTLGIGYAGQEDYGDLLGILIYL